MNPENLSMNSPLSIYSWSNIGLWMAIRKLKFYWDVWNQTAFWNMKHFFYIIILEYLIFENVFFYISIMLLQLFHRVSSCYFCCEPLKMCIFIFIVQSRTVTVLREWVRGFFWCLNWALGSYHSCVAHPLDACRLFYLICVHPFGTELCIILWLAVKHHFILHRA